MNGSQLREWRIAQGYRQTELAEELGVKSRTTLSAWENTDGDVPRLVDLAIQALEHVPSCRRIYGKEARQRERDAYFAERT